jgi:type IV pilus assembly protein PilF
MVMQLNLFRQLGLPSLLVALFCASLVGCATVNRNQEEAELRSRIGTGYLQRGNYPAALRELLRAEAADPENVFVQNNLGLVYFMRERYDIAAEHLERAIQLNPKYSDARNNLARAYIELGRFEPAKKQLDLVLADLTYEDPPKAWINYGLIYFRKKDFDSARQKFAEAIRINRDNCLAQTLYGRSFLEQGKTTTAAEALDNAVVVCRPSRYDEPFYYSGLAYYKLGRTSAAIARMEEIVKLYPQGTYAPKAESMLKLMR